LHHALFKLLAFEDMHRKFVLNQLKVTLNTARGALEKMDMLKDFE